MNTQEQVRILREAAEEFKLESEENFGVNKSVCLQTSALSIVATYIADQMEQNCRDNSQPSNGHPAIVATERELVKAQINGWNDAIERAASVARCTYEDMPDDKFDDTTPDEMIELIVSAITRLRKDTPND